MDEIRLSGVSKRYPDGTLALAPADLTIAPGRFLTLLGPSGCGKSTLLRLIAGLSPPSTGTITGVPDGNDTDVGDTDEGDNDGANPGHPIGFVFQEPTLMPWANVFENVALPFRLSSTQDQETISDRVNGALAMVGLEAFSQRLPRQLSGGMKMRVSLARALVTRPRILLLDEPFAALDEITRHALNDDLLRLWRHQGVTTVFVTHSVSEAVYLSQEIAVMSPRPGRIREILPVDLPGDLPENQNTDKLAHEGDRGPDIRTTVAFNALAARVSASLHAGIEESRS